MAASTRRTGESGRGLIGFIVALAVVIYVAIALKGVFQVTSRASKFEDYVYEQIKSADQNKYSEEDVRGLILAKARELDVPLKDARRIEVQNSGAGWHVHVEWDDAYVIPGFTYPRRFEIDKEWKRF